MPDDKRKPPQKAVAIKYIPEADTAPRVVASGQGFVAEKIIEKGADEGVKTYKDEILVDELYKVDIGAHIPPELYEIVAQVLVFIDDIDKLQGLRRMAKQ